jgi:hypothetical protein
MTTFPSLSIVGGLLPGELFTRVADRGEEVPSMAPESYGLERSESVQRQAARCWPYLQDMWKEFKERKDKTPETHWQRLTRERWLQILLRELGFTHLKANGGFEIEGKRFPVSHRSNGIPIHLLAWQTNLDHRTKGLAGAARAPHSMMQELLNRSDECLWAILSNGCRLRLLRDSTSLTGSSYVEFDLEAIFDGELFSDFRVMYLVCHKSRFDADEGGGPSSCPLEVWHSFAADLATRALGDLRAGVETAVNALGTGFLSHPRNGHLHARIVSRELDKYEFNRAILRLIYRLLFWFVAEDRDVLLQPFPDDADETTLKQLRLTRERYRDYFSSTRLRMLSRKRHGSRHTDLWEGIRLVFAMLGLGDRADVLSLPGLGGIFEPSELDAPLDGARLGNDALLQAVRALSLTQSNEGGGLRPVDFVNLGSDELGSVYESLLELHPEYDDETRVYKLVLRGHERKATGSYFTPPALVECLLDETLDPLLDDACAKPTRSERIEALLNTTVCDPACGSGHFLIAAARRIAKRVAIEESGDPEPPISDLRAALRSVLGPCIYGVDINPLAAELARLSLCLEAMEPGKPLNFLEPNIRVGNSLLGVTPNLLRDGIPNAAFAPLPLDDRRVAVKIKKENQDALDGNEQLPAPVGHTPLPPRMAKIVRVVPNSLREQQTKQRAEYEEITKSSDWRSEEMLADGWCAAFVQHMTLTPSLVERLTAITQGSLRRLIDEPEMIDTAYFSGKIQQLAEEYQFFHWHSEFRHIFWNGLKEINPETGWTKGFSCVISNPPWERVKLQEQEFFEFRRTEIARAPNAAARKKMIAALAESANDTDRRLFKDFQRALRKSAGWNLFLSASGRYPLTGKGDINTYAVFAETARSITAPRGRMGLILPTGIATDKTTSAFFCDTVEDKRLDCLLDFVTNPRIWTDVGHRRYRFAILVISGRQLPIEQANFWTLAKHPDELPPRGQRIHVATDDLLLVNPNTGTSPMFRSQRDADITLAIHERVPVLWRESPDDNPWGISFMAMFHMANDSGLFHTRHQLEADGWTLNTNIFVKDDKRMLPLYEAKLTHQFDHRLSCYSKRPTGSRDTELPRLRFDEKNDPLRVPIPRYWLPLEDIEERLRGRWQKGWLLGWRDITNVTNERTVVSTFIPRTAVGDKFLLVFTAENVGLLQANLASFVLDFVARRKFTGTSLKYFVLKQLPILPPDSYSRISPWERSGSLSAWISARVLELTYTAYDMAALAQELGDEGEPFVWEEDRRALLRAELDAAYFHLYGIDRDDVDYIMETFPIVKRKDEAAFGDYRTKRLILEVYDAMAEATRTGEPYQTVLDPPPGQGPRHSTRFEG